MWIDLTGLDWIQSPSGVLQCSASCGKGTQKRTVTCTNSQGKCDASTRPRAEEPCEDYSGCYEWKTGSWSKVSMVPARPSCPGSGGASGAQPSHILPRKRRCLRGLSPLTVGPSSTRWSQSHQLNSLSLPTPHLLVTPYGVHLEGP